MDSPVSLRQLVLDIRKDIRGCPYLLLRLPILSELNDIRKSFKRLSLELHPDKKDGNKELFQQINNAHYFLSNPDWKLSYDNIIWRHYRFGSNDTERAENHLRWSDYLLTESNSTRDGSKLSTEESTKPTKDDSTEDSEESSQSTANDDFEKNSEGGSQSTINDNEESPEIPFLSSHKIATHWFTAGTDREETRRISNDIVAHTIFDILMERQSFVGYWKDNVGEYETDVKCILKCKAFIYTNVVDYINLKMFEFNCHIFPLCCQATMDLYRTERWGDVKHQLNKNSYRSKWSILREENRDKNNIHNDYDMIEQQAMNKELIFSIPINLDNRHYIHVTRRWFQAKLFFFFTDSNDLSANRIESSNTLKQIPRNVLYFLMDTPLWPVGQKAYWIRLPSVRQLENECATRMLLHSYIVAISPTHLKVCYL